MVTDHVQIRAYFNHNYDIISDWIEEIEKILKRNRDDLEHMMHTVKF